MTHTPLCGAHKMTNNLRKTNNDPIENWYTFNDWLERQSWFQSKSKEQQEAYRTYKLNIQNYTDEDMKKMHSWYIKWKRKTKNKRNKSINQITREDQFPLQSAAEKIAKLHNKSLKNKA